MHLIFSNIVFFFVLLGIITSNGRLDYEQKSIYKFSILLEPTHLNCSIKILIYLININDNPIIFNRTSLIYNINENNIIPLYIGRIQLVDIDQLYLSKYEFYLIKNSSSISIDRMTGSIILHEKFDREYDGSKLEYEIMAIDINNKEKNIRNKLIIYIDDQNDHGPRFNQNFYSINISKFIRPNTILFQLNATSKDPIVNGNFKYYLMKSSEYFSIDQQTGIIRLKTFLPSILKNFTLNIRVIEDQINLTDDTNLFIRINNDNNNYFHLENCSLEENQNIGTKICTIGIKSNDLIYQLIDRMNYFHIIENNGTIMNKKIFDYENDQHEYNITIIVKDRENQV